MEDKDLYNAIWRRRSVRAFSEKHIEKDKIEALRGSISSLNGISGLTMGFIEESDSFHSLKAFRFKNVRSVITVKGRTNDPHLDEKCGYYGERIVLEAAALGLGTCWVAVTFNKKSGSLDVKEDETIVCAIPVGYGAEEMTASADVPDAPHRKTKSISDFLGGNTDVPDWVKAAVKAVQFAPTAMNNQRTGFSYVNGTISAQTKEGRLNMVDFGITKLHFELAAKGKFDLGTPSEFVPLKQK